MCQQSNLSYLVVMDAVNWVTIPDSPIITAVKVVDVTIAEPVETELSISLLVRSFVEILLCVQTRCPNMQ